MLSIKEEGILLLLINRSERILDLSFNKTEEEFYKNIDLQELICFNLLQMGELINKLTNQFLKNHNEIEWKKAIGLRHRIVHGYESIDLKSVWDTVSNNIKPLLDYCNKILETEK